MKIEKCPTCALPIPTGYCENCHPEPKLDRRDSAFAIAALVLFALLVFYFSS